MDFDSITSSHEFCAAVLTAFCLPYASEFFRDSNVEDSKDLPVTMFLDFLERLERLDTL